MFATDREVDVPQRHAFRARPTSDGQMPEPAEDSLFPGGGLPAPETLERRRSIQLVAVLALVVSVVYLTWRVCFTLGGDLWISLPLWILELYVAVGLGLFTFSLWNLDRQLVPEPVRQTDLRVGVLIPTYNEPIEVLFPTVAAAVALEPGHETYVLDDGQRLWVRAMAASLGASYIAREEHTHAKAGNVNHALAQLDLDVVAILDADHIADGGLLTNTLGYFEDPRVAVVQTPQDFYNLDSFEHSKNRSWFWRARRPVSFNEQRLFYRAIQPGKNRWKAAFWCGTNAVVRVRAIAEIGGIADETVTEDMHTTMRLYSAGWRSVYVPEILTRGLVPSTLSAYCKQQLKWACGSLELLLNEYPRLFAGMTWWQRLPYFVAPLYFLRGFFCSRCID